MNYSISINSLERFVSDGYVYRIHYTLTASESGHSVFCNKSVDLIKPDLLVPFEDLTEDIVESWVVSTVSEEDMLDMKKTLADRLIESKKEITSTGLPWEQKETVSV